MPEARVQLAIEIETEGAEELTALRRELEQLGQVGEAAFGRLDAALNTTVERLEQARALVGAATQGFLESHRRLFSSLDPVFEGFFRRLLSGTRSFGDAMKRLLSDLLRYFLRTLEQMVGAWLSGFQLMSGAPPVLSGGSGGGFLGSILTAGLGIPGLLGTGGVGGTPPTFPSGGGGGGSATNLNLLSQLGIPLRDLTLGSLTIPGGLLASGGLFLGLTGVQRGSPVLGALGGAAAGFAFGGPIGAAIGALAGLLGGIFSRGKKKRQASRIAEAGFAEMREIVEQFRRFQIDFETALAQINALWEQMQAGWRQLGGSILRRSVRGELPEFNQIVGELKQIQSARETRTRLMAGLPIPEFQTGGLVRGANARDGRLLAFLHAGEAVLNRRAVQMLGPGFVEQANRTPSLQAGGVVSPAGEAAGLNRPSVTVQIYIDGRGSDAEAVAAYTIRKLKRELADRGLSL
jgi:hypothetical protein